ncbi:MAG: 2-oxoglutarate dehydrogenase E1 component [Bacteroidetes bacterium]|jgi:2-oxoglutarate dehydrogenase E1 component|nr:2-oxoglutarate dehydrogenase E1 component [Bacteroidota bacterium]
MDEFSFLGNSDISSIEELYQKYKTNDDTLDNSWINFFKGFEFARQNYSESPESNVFNKEFKVLNFIHAYRKRGHLFTETNPVRTRRKYFPSLDHQNYELEDEDLDKVFHAGEEVVGCGTGTLRDIIAYLKETYCKSIGAEYMFIRKPDRISWLQNRIESSRNKTEFTPEQKKEIFDHLKLAVGFERFIHKKFVGQKRFSLEGTETLIPALNYLINKGSELGIQEFVMGMAHRGRLNVLANILHKPYENVFQEFIADEYEDSIALGDVKYHLGYMNDVKTVDGKNVKLNLAPNPSHLEAVSPIIQGIARARIDHNYQADYKNVCPIIIHGDAALAGQGVVYEVIQMSELQGYKTGGTIHIVINNQIGFTTNYLDARSSTYCTDVGKVTKAPIFHVNGDDVEALVHTVIMAIEYRQTFHSDVFIDILSYRKFGHNESDEPRFTQPLLYKEISKHPNPRDIYAKKLIEQNIYSEEQIKTIQDDFEDILSQKFDKSKEIKKTRIQQFLHEDWKGFKYAENGDFSKTIKTGIPAKKIKELAAKVNYLPEKEKFISKTHKLINERMKMIENNQVDWAMGELLAYATLLEEGYPVRISGQDSVRGTFSHRHAAHTIEDTDKLFTPLKHMSDSQPRFDIYNSPLNEYGVLGFEYGYALACPTGLTIWEAQFGDFVNMAQVIIDQYISSAEEKWGLMNGLVMFLPHGYEGQGPEHSSARMERFLSMATRNNMHLVNCTTPANFFHLLRNHIKSDYRVPLVVFTPKSLLRHPKCISGIEHLENDQFQELIDDNNVEENEVRRIVFCSGKIYYDLLAKKEEFNATDIALVRIEQLHPFPLEKVNAVIKKYKNNLLNLWVQEEPENMGAWRHVLPYFDEITIMPVTRQASGSPATGLSKIHQMTQEEIIGKVFRKCDCERKLDYCGLQCLEGSTRQEVLKQHSYILNNH